jgi:ubiquinone/menaquinone biosynthesis C-methylase UbiE
MARYQFFIDRLNEIGFSRDGFVVDCACGLGQGTLLLHNSGLTVKGFDISRKIIDKYVKPLGVNAEYADIVDLPLSDSSVAVFVCSETLEHLEKDKCREAAKEIGRVCVESALICVSVPLHKKSLKNPSHKQYIKADKIKKLFDFCDVVYKGVCNTHSKKKKGNLVVILRVNRDES